MPPASANQLLFRHPHQSRRELRRPGAKRDRPPAMRPGCRGLLRALLAGLLLAGPAHGQVVSFADKGLGLGLGYTRPRTVWRTGYDLPQQTNGFSLCLVHDLTSAENGLGITAFFNAGQVRNGLFISPILCDADTLRGVALTSFVGGQRLSGLLVGFMYVGGGGLLREQPHAECEQLNGLAFSYVQVQAHTLNGLAVAGYVRSRRQRGLTLALLNRSEQLRGMQLGLLNYAGNNPRGLRWLPLVNLHL